MTVLHQLLDQNAKLNPVFKGFLSNHLPMALTALERMHAAPDRLNQYFQYYIQAKRLDIMHAKEKNDLITKKNWENYLGQKVYYPNYIEFFTQEIKTHGVEQTLRTYSDKLLQGITSLHGLIRLAYAIESHHQTEIIAALAHFSAYYMELSITKSKTGNEQNPLVVFEKIKIALGDSRKPYTEGSIYGRLIKAASLPEFSEWVDSLAINSNTLPDCAALLISLYASTKDFVVLHAVTTTHALRVVIPYVNDQHAALSHYWRMLCALYIAVGAPQLSSKTISFKAENWGEIFKHIINHEDDHDIKLVYTCYEENKIYQNPLYYYVAEMIVKMHILDNKNNA